MHGDPRAYILLFLPLLAALGAGTIGLRRRGLAAGLALVAVWTSFALVAWMFLEILTGHPPATGSFDWILLGEGTPEVLRIPFGVQIDPLSILMGLVVTGVGGLIFVYSLGYMHDDPSFSRYFTYLAVFIFSMLGIVFSTNFLQIFVFWELVGLASYLLIGFWYQKPSAADAGKKAFLVNRVGDFGFLLGILIVFFAQDPANGPRTLEFDGLAQRLALGEMDATTLALAGACIFCGVLGKSAQFPLHVWLPDAMEGPTPVSALIHAATMVAAGVYLLCRAFFLFEGSPVAMDLIAAAGGVTALMAATVALVQRDIKRVLAYSTLSQLGYMVLAIGLGGTIAGMFHLTTHAFFKALLFLGSGSVIHAVHTQDMHGMGGLRRFLPVTTWTFAIGLLALSGIPPFAGFFSKDEILAVAHDHNTILYGVAVFSAFLTAVYSTRLWIYTFTGSPRGHGQPHESPRVMTIPLVVLAVFSCLAGFLGWPGLEHGLSHFLHPETAEGAEETFHLSIMLGSTVVAVLGIVTGWRLFRAGPQADDALRARFPRTWMLLEKKYYFDEAYGFLVDRVQGGISAFAALFERLVIIGTAVNGTVRATLQGGVGVGRLQSGLVRRYALLFLTGVLLILAWLTVPAPAASPRTASSPPIGVSLPEEHP